MWETLLAIRHYGCPVSDVCALHPDVQLQNISRSEIHGRTSKRILCAQGDPTTLDSFAETFRDREEVHRFETLGGSGGKTRYFSVSMEYDSTNPSIARLIEEHGCFQHNTVPVRKGIEQWTIYSRRKSVVRAVADAVESLDNDVDIRRSKDCTEFAPNNPLKFASLRKELTQRQIHAFRTALELGYYRSGDISMEDLGHAMDLHPSTAWEHLKKAENVLLTEIGLRLFPQQPTNEEAAQ